jgi:hypothetical protein
VEEKTEGKVAEGEKPAEEPAQEEALAAAEEGEATEPVSS